MTTKTLAQQWSDLLENQTKESFKAFWTEYSDAEKKLYAALLASPDLELKGVFADLAKEYSVKPALLMGFLDGINTSIVKEIDLENVEETDEIDIKVLPEKLFFNMLEADAEHLYTLPEWENVLTEEKQLEIHTEYRRSRTVVKEKLPGRNNPCPCGSGKKYKKCCGA